MPNITPTRSMYFVGNVLTVRDLRGLDADLSLAIDAINELVPNTTKDNILVSDGNGNISDSGIIVTSLATNSAVDNKVDKINITTGSIGAANKTSMLNINSQGQVAEFSEIDIAIPSSAITDANMANGVVKLESTGLISRSYLPTGTETYLGNWDASTNTPTLAAGTGNSGDTYHVNVSGIQDLGEGEVEFNKGDNVVYNGSVWQKQDQTDNIGTVFGRKGNVIGQSGDYNTDLVTEGSTNLYYTKSRAQTDAALLEAPLFISADTTVDATQNRVIATITSGETVPPVTITITTPSVNLSKFFCNAKSSVTNLLLVDSTGTTIDLGNGTNVLEPGESTWLSYDSTANSYVAHS